MTNGWQFIDNQGSFQLPDPQHTNYLYFPLLNEAGMVSSITPTLNGDLKTNQNTFLLLPTSVEDLHNSRSARNFWLRINGDQVWSATGNSSQQTSKKFSADDENVKLTAGFLWHTITREHQSTGLQAEITNFVPAGNDTVEMMRVKITNLGNKKVTLTPTAAIPIYARSADNLRDHRHVTSLLHRISCIENGVVVRPTLSFDERGHIKNETTYAVLGVEEDQTNPVGFFPDIEGFIGEGGSLDWPQAVIGDELEAIPAGAVVAGYEALGGLRFNEIELGPNEERSYILILTILEGDRSIDTLLDRYASGEKFSHQLEDTKQYWLEKISTLSFSTSDPQFDNWLKWITLQPILRRRIGNSFLPYHDYGRGGRGWRDLWQDILALLIMDTREVSDTLLGHFAGVRMDGSNATIIGINSGEFKADRNDIPRVWMDHGLWPLMTTNLYINQTGKIDFLLQEQVYFKDHLSHRAQRRDSLWLPEQGTMVRTNLGEIYRGSVLEHLLIQHLTAFFNVGEHNNIRLEDADWNDALDMAAERGESVSFTAFYSGNLRILSELCQTLSDQGVKTISITKELFKLVDSLSSSVDYQSISEKHQRLEEYFDLTSHSVSGEKVEVPLVSLANDLLLKADWLAEHIQKKEWIDNGEDSGWFNSYYDNQGNRVEGVFNQDIRMMLTGQVFTMMFGIASDEQAEKIVNSADRYLFDRSVGGYRLNTNFGDNVSHLGRVFGFAYGHKENGAMFSHMAAMFANALYKRKLVKAGWKVLKGIYHHSQDFSKSRMYPGIPEYFSQRGRGMYPYLTGSASWFLLTMLNEVYGIKGKLGDLVLKPKLTREQFSADGKASVHTVFANKNFDVTYINSQALPYGQYVVSKIIANGAPILEDGIEEFAILNTDQIASFPDQVTLEVYLQAK
jgi:cellobiose phosphorylase